MLLSSAIPLGLSRPLRCSRFSAAPTSLRRYFRPRPSVFVDVIQPERFTEVPAFGPETPHVIGESCFTNPLSVGGHRAA
jgi:hypothetical protein